MLQHWVFSPEQGGGGYQFQCWSYQQSYHIPFAIERRSRRSRQFLQTKRKSLREQEIARRESLFFPLGSN